MKLFGSPKAPAPAPAPEPAPVPIVDKDAMAREAGDRLRKRRGRASTMLSPTGAPGPTVGTATLMGAG